MIKFIKNWLLKRKAIKQLKKISNEDLLEAQKILKWLSQEEPSIYFRLNEEEINYLKTNYIIPWQEKDYDDSFFDWESNSPYSELNYLLDCFKGHHGFIKMQDSFDYFCRLHPHLLDFHQELAKENILCGP